MLIEDENTDEILDDSNATNLQSKSRSMGSLASLFNTSSVSRQRALATQSINSLNAQNNSPKLKKEKMVKNANKKTEDLLTNSSSVDSDEDEDDDDEDDEKVEEDNNVAVVDKRQNKNEINIIKNSNEKKLQKNPPLPYVRRFR